MLRRLGYKDADEEEKGSVCIVTRAGSSLRTRNKSVQRWAATWMLSRSVRGHLCASHVPRNSTGKTARNRLRSPMEPDTVAAVRQQGVSNPRQGKHPTCFR